MHGTDGCSFSGGTRARGDAFDNELSPQFVRRCLVFYHDLAICRSGKCEVVGGGKHPGGSWKTAGLYVADGGALGVVFLVRSLRKCGFLELGNWGFFFEREKELYGRCWNCSWRYGRACWAAG